jgi:ribosome-binding protein aMBF1 (putative translation factor)
MEHCPDCGKYRWNYDQTICLSCHPPKVSKEHKKTMRKRKQQDPDWRDHYYHEWITSARTNKDVRHG